MKIIALCLLLLASALSAVHGQDAMCGTDIVSPVNVTSFQYLGGVAFKVTPLRAVSNPVFSVMFPSGLFFGPNIQQDLLTVDVSGCIAGSDKAAKVTIFSTTGVVSSNPGAITGILQVGIPCVINVTRNNFVDFYDLRTPLTVLGNSSAAGNFYTGWQVVISDSNGVIMNVGTDATNHTAQMRVLNELQTMQLTGTSGSTTGITGIANSLDSLQITFTPAIPDPRTLLFDDSSQVPPIQNIVKLGPSTYQVNVSFNQDLFTGPDLDQGFGTFLMDVSGCITATGINIWTNFSGRTLTANLASNSPNVQMVSCTITIRKNASAPVAGSIAFKLYQTLNAQVTIIDNHHIAFTARNIVFDGTPAVPLYLGTSGGVSTTAFNSFLVATEPAVLQAGTAFSTATFTVVPKNVGYSTTSIRLLIQGFVFSNWDVLYGGETTRDFAFDVTGCGAAISSGFASSSCTVNYCSLTMDPSFAWNLQSGTCTITVKKQQLSNLQAVVPTYSTALQFTLGLIDYNTDRGLSPTDSVNYGQYAQQLYGLSNAKVTLSSSFALTQLDSVVVEAVANTAIGKDQDAQLWLTVPKILGIQNTKAYTVKVDGCTSAVSTNVVIPDVPSCTILFNISLPAGISAGSKCVVTLVPSSSNPGLLMTPSADYNVVLGLTTASFGAPVDTANPSALTVTPVHGSSSSGGGSSVNVSSASLARSVNGVLLVLVGLTAVLFLAF